MRAKVGLTLCWNAAPAASEICIIGPIRHYFPGHGQSSEPQLAPRSGNLTPPRISPSCPHCLRLWLGRGTIVGGQGHCKTACQGCFRLDGDRWAPYLAVFDAGKPAQVVLARPTHRFSSFGGLSADVIHSLDIHFSSCTGRNERTPSLSLPLSEGVERKFF